MNIRIDNQTPEYLVDSPNELPTVLPAPAPSAVESFHRKRKHATAFHESSPSPAPQLLPTLANDEDPSSFRPRLNISRHPMFTPVSNLPNFYNTDLIPSNRIGYRYTPAGLTPPGSTLLQRTIEDAPTSSRVSWSDRSPFIKVTQDGLSLAGDRGFRSARFNAPLREGQWFFEVKILQGGGDFGDSTLDKPSSGGHVRLGFARREAPLNGPAGLDGYSYGIRDKTGEKVHISRPRPYTKPFGTDDVVGLYVSLPPRRMPDSNDPEDPAHLKRERIAIEFKGQEYFESLEYGQEKEMMEFMEPKKKIKTGGSNQRPGTNRSSQGKKSATVKNMPNNRKTGHRRGTSSVNNTKTIPSRPLPTLEDSHIAFFINGECQGVAFQDLYSYLPLHRHSTEAAKQHHHYRNEEAIREHKPNPFDDGTLGYYPFISLFNEAKVKVNVGPDFEFWPGDDIEAILGFSKSIDVKTEDGQNSSTPKRTWRPLCERYSEFMEEQWAMDKKEEVEAALAVSNGFVPSEMPKKPKETVPTRGHTTGGRVRKGGRRGRGRGGRKKDTTFRGSESIYGERSEGSMTPALFGTFGEDGENYNSLRIENDERFGQGVVAMLSVPSTGYGAQSSSPAADYVSEQGEPSDMDGNDVDFDVEIDDGQRYERYASEGTEDLDPIELEFEQAAASSAYRVQRF